jgi:hypothetical protein
MQTQESVGMIACTYTRGHDHVYMYIWMLARSPLSAHTHAHLGAISLECSYTCGCVHLYVCTPAGMIAIMSTYMCGHPYAIEYIHVWAWLCFCVYTHLWAWACCMCMYVRTQVGMIALMCTYSCGHDDDYAYIQVGAWPCSCVNRNVSMVVRWMYMHVYM